MKLWAICALVIFFGIVGVSGQEATPEVTPEATALPLTETFTSADGQVSFQYPEGWVIEDSSEEYTWLTLYSIPPEEGTDSIFEGNVMVSIEVGYVQQLFRNLDEDAGLEDVMRTNHARYNLSPQIPLESFNSLSIGGYPAGIISKTLNMLTDNNERYQREMWTLAIDYGDGIFANIVLHIRTELVDQWIPTTIAIAESIQFNGATTDPSPSEEAIAEETPDPFSVLFSAVYTSEAGNVSISYPEMWFIRETIDSTIEDTWFEIVSSPRSIGRDFPLSGDVILIARIGRVDRIFRGIRSSDITYVEILQALHDGLQAQASEAGSNI